MSLPLSVSVCCLKLEVDDDIASDSVSIENKSSSNYVPGRGLRKTHEIQIESFSNMMFNSSEDGILPSGSKETTSANDEPINEYSLEDKHFFSGNPFVEITKGIIHLYKRNDTLSTQDGPSKILCLIAVPATINCHDLLNFISPCHPVLQHIRIIRDGAPSQFMVLLEFRTIDSAMEFYQTYNGTAYNNLEPDSVCHVVWVSSFEWSSDDIKPTNHTELPTCPVCLERMDESVDGVLTILCNHAFHANCLVKWGDSTCPVCRYVQTPELAESSVCMECEGTEALWICLICGHVGCGRYQSGHAASHHRSTNHTYAMQLGTNRVWDYAGDNFVHRLLQNKSDGKLVATQTQDSDGEDKIDSMQLEFTFLLTSQLDTQREYYEKKITRLENMLEMENKNFKSLSNDLQMKCSVLSAEMNNIQKEKGSLEKKNATLTVKLSTSTKNLADEKQISHALQENLAAWQTKYSCLEDKFKEYEVLKDNEITNLKEQLRDLMFYIEAQDSIAKSDLKNEMQDASVVLTEPPLQSSTSNSSDRRRKMKK